MSKFFKNFYLLSEEELKGILDDPMNTYLYTCIVGTDKEEVADASNQLDEIDEILVDQSKLHITPLEAVDRIRKVFHGTYESRRQYGEKPKPVVIKQYEPWVKSEVSCPVCGDNSLIDVANISSANYCPNCGQPIDFSNVPEEFFDD